MIINFQKLKNLPVETEKGIHLGDLIDIEINVNDHSITKYLANDKKYLITGNKFLISPEQIISISEEKIIVADNTVLSEEQEKATPALNVEEAGIINAKLENRL
ncbi:PRC-barrel domain-containing protein [Patescibacteria group bacterium]|nr:PRC-barrel domain-containing protein [Patescibacteria group bacterium]